MSQLRRQQPLTAINTTLIVKDARMSVFSLLNVSTGPEDGGKLVDALQQACYHRITHHLRQLNEESDPERSLQLMEPSRFGEMARQACCEVSDAVFKVTRDAGRRAEPGNVGLTRDDIATALVPCLGDFGRVLDSYSGEHVHFTRLLADAKGGFVERHFNAGYHGAAVGDSLFGPLGAVAGALLNGFFAGKAVENAIDAAGEKLDHEFREMLGAWDEAMAAMTGDAVQMIRFYAERVVAGEA
jgi:hypothetical protein